jgi:hypothetical protein
MKHLQTLALAIAVLCAATATAKAGDDFKPQADPAAVAPVQSDYAVVVPSGGLPADVQTQNANNNLDVVRHDGRVFLAFRTGPTHFASPNVVMYVVSSEDQTNWIFEAKFARGTDLREPRFLSLNGKLFLYMAVLGANQFDFEPKGMIYSEYNGPGNWAEPREFLEKGFIPWRTKVIGGTPYMLAYRGGENIYDFQEGASEEIHFLTTTDGVNWTGVTPDKPVVHVGGCSETDFEFAPDGAIIAVCRNEMGDQDGFGSKVCRAEKDTPSEWTCTPDPKKYDSPLVFKHNGEIYLVGRRHLTKSGNYDLNKRKLGYKSELMKYQVDYWQKPKRCSIWRVDPATLKVSFIEDLPSKGDTCFASVIPMDDDSLMLYNYSSPPDGPDISWNQGQQGHTLIYRTLLTFPKK